MKKYYEEKLLPLFYEHKSKLPMIVFFVLGVLIIHKGVEYYKKSIGLGQPMTEVLISTDTINAGQKISRKNLTTMKVPAANTPMGVLKPNDFSKASELTLNRTVSRGEMIFWNSFNTSFNYHSPSAKIEDGYRAVSIGVDALSSVSNMVQPGDHVDLISSMIFPGDTKTTTLTVLQNVSVLSVGEGQGDEESQKSYGTITLMVLPNEVNLITHAAKFGNLTLTLRNPMDSKTNPELNLISEQEIVQTSFRNHMQTIRDLASQIEKNN